ncbi:hypothetical protein [Paenibacillus sp. J2TS4]|uniref:hypothetical protein n=1 Tax=Paenibacillus sp. J2TS4 TaxID=2807194 RepID=UPI001B283EA5|nr:hypothetical protein [Paenibacillus sp. J2TS4]GIP35759.1 hypothetical protein J2TS4_49690 [Paenibacillus sp. J2TS4]
MRTWQTRKTDILRLAAETALALPVLPSGFWFHKDIRDNLFYALHLHVAACREDIALPVDDHTAKTRAEEMLLRVLRLQQRNPEEERYGHWPLNLGDEPASAPPHPLPAELVGNILSLYYVKFKAILSHTLQEELQTSLTHLYQSRLYEIPQQAYHHHEAKLFNMKIALGTTQGDAALVEEGHQNLLAILNTLRTKGMQEYGCLPWFWHWVQAFTCTWEMTDQPQVKETAASILEWLWTYRAKCYLKGVWIGPRSRSLGHDAPADRNFIADYIQFGDFELPSTIYRLEGFALFDYEVPATIVEMALDETPTEWNFAVPPHPHTANKEPLYQTIYRTGQFAVGGVYKRVEEFDNEQIRWTVSLPIRKDATANQAYFFHPGKRYKPLDLRHASDYGEILLHRQAVAALYPVPEGEDGTIVGSLPLGQWTTRGNDWYGRIDNLYLAVYLANPASASIARDQLALGCPGSDNGVLMEVIETEAAEAQGIASLEQLAEKLAGRRPQFVRDEQGTAVSYRTLRNDDLLLHVADSGQVERKINGRDLAFDSFESMTRIVTRD